MTSKEAYRVLQKAWTMDKEAKDYPSFDDINEALYTIKQDLERIKALENENQELKERQKDILNANVELSFDNYKHKKAIEILKGHLDLGVYISQGEYILCANDYAIPPLDKEKGELLSEVLKNEKRTFNQ